MHDILELIICHKTLNKIFKKTFDALRKLNIRFYLKQKFRKMRVFL